MRKLTTTNNNGLTSFGRNLWPTDFFNSFWNDDFFPSFSSGMKTDVRETASDYIIDIEVPGLSRENIELNISDNMLTVSAKAEENNEVKDGDKYIRRERKSGVYRRSFSMDSVDTDKINAKLDNGILTITCPKLEQTVSTSKRIDIN